MTQQVSPKPCPVQGPGRGHRATHRVAAANGNTACQAATQGADWQLGPMGAQRSPVQSYSGWLQFWSYSVSHASEQRIHWFQEAAESLRNRIRPGRDSHPGAGHILALAQSQKLEQRLNQQNFARQADLAQLIKVPIRESESVYHL